MTDAVKSEIVRWAVIAGSEHVRVIKNGAMFIFTHDEVRDIAREAKKVRCENLDVVMIEKIQQRENPLVQALESTAADVADTGFRRWGDRSRRQHILSQLRE